MITTSQEWKDRIYDNRSALLLRAELKLHDGTILYLDHEDGDDDFLSDGISLTDETTAENTFAIGSAIMNMFSFKLNNAAGKYDTTLFQDAEIYPQIGMDIDGTVEWLDKGVFVVTDPGGRGNAITFQTFDRMSKMHLAFSGVNVLYPITIGALAQAICDYCGVPLASASFPNHDYEISSAPIVTNLNCRQVISFIAQIAGCYARFNNVGELEITWYGTTENEIPEYKSLEVDLVDTIITGIKVTSYYSDTAYSEESESGEVTESSVYGEEGYVIAITENPLILYGQSSVVAELIGSRIVGTRFRSLDLSTLHDPSLEAGDVIKITDVRGNSYVSFITNLSVNLGGYVKISCGAETAEENAVSGNYAGNQAVLEAVAIANAKFKNLITVNLETEVAKLGYVSAKEAELTYAKIKTLKALEGKFDDLEADAITTDQLDAENAKLGYLKTKDADVKYANIDFANIGSAAMEYLYAQSGLIENVVIKDGVITGEIVGVTIKGDLIEGGTVKADKLVILGSDGLYYKLNTNGETVESEQTEYNSLDGKHILAKSITATKINVSDLVAFGATIGGFNIKKSSIYSGAKESVDNTTRGIYMDAEGQWVVGDSRNFIKYYKDENGEYKLDISAKSVSIRSPSDSDEEEVEVPLEDAINDLKSDIDNLRDEITTLLRIESSRGTVFKNDTVATVLSVVIYHGTQRITDSATMKTVFGNGAYLQWKWQRLDDNSFGIISSSDSRFGDNGFTFTLSPNDVDTKVTFMCELIT